MTARITMPKLGMEMREGSVTAWSFKKGDAVSQGDVVVQIETGKFTYEGEAPESGILRKIFIARLRPHLWERCCAESRPTARPSMSGSLPPRRLQPNPPEAG